jgi:hypothetical protein
MQVVRAPGQESPRYARREVPHAEGSRRGNDGCDVLCCPRLVLTKTRGREVHNGLLEEYGTWFRPYAGVEDKRRDSRNWAG